MILTDGILGQMMEPLEFDFEPIDPKTLPPKDYTLGNAEKEGRERRVVRSYDLGSGGMEKHCFKLQAKFDQIEANEVRFEDYYLDGAEIVIVAYGSCARIAKSSVTLGHSQGIKIGLLRPITLWPFPTKVINQIASKVENILVAEMSLGQLIDDVKIAVEGKAKIHLHARPSGGIPTPEEILDKVKNILKS
jgi:2-oxoglutarate ferredoxin oxidoreductase subunit alpha